MLASRIAIARQCPSEPPAKSVPKRCTTQASLMSCGSRRRRAPVERTVEPGIPDRHKLLDTGQEQPVDALLAAEVPSRLYSYSHRPSGSRIVRLMKISSGLTSLRWLA